MRRLSGCWLANSVAGDFRLNPIIEDVVVQRCSCVFVLARRKVRLCVPFLLLFCAVSRHLLLHTKSNWSLLAALSHLHECVYADSDTCCRGKLSVPTLCATLQPCKSADETDASDNKTRVGVGEAQINFGSEELARNRSLISQSITEIIFSARSATVHVSCKK